MARPSAGAGPFWRTWTQTVRGLSWRDRALLLEAAALVAALPLVLRITGVRQLAHVMNRRRLKPHRGYPAGGRQRAQEISRIVAMASRHTPTSDTCLHRSFALWWILGRDGLDSTLHIGARRSGEGLGAHAWVEHAGAVLNDDAGVGRDHVPLSLFPDDKRP